MISDLFARILHVKKKISRYYYFINLFNYELFAEIETIVVQIIQVIHDFENFLQSN